MTFYQAIYICFSKYTYFKGRAKRSEYWYWRLFELFLALISYRLDILFFPEKETYGSFSLFIFFFTLMPGISVSIRRLHDIDKSGWWLLLTLTGVGNLLLLYWFLLPSKQYKNIYD